MYWYKSNLPRFITCLGGFVLIVFNIACKPNVGDSATTQKYFDVKGYFDSEAARLTKQNKPVLKTVTYNKSVETKTVFIKDWTSELEFFKSADINKPAWKDSYSIDTSGGFMIFKAKDPNLKMVEMVVKKQGNKVKWVLIFNHTKNLLYQTKEKLSYFPDSVYLIQKKQSVRVLGTNLYTIRGIFNH